MPKQSPRILVVSSSTAFSRILRELEVTGLYDLEYSSSPESIRCPLLPLSTPIPDAILLHVPSDPLAADEVLAWLEKVKDQTPVVVISTLENTRFYLAAMKRGAFDYVTCYTPVTEIHRVLQNAVHWPRQDVA